jgi:streptomycin 6-kinase
MPKPDLVELTGGYARTRHEHTRELAILMREDPVELGGDERERAPWLAARTGCDASAIWEWGAVERVSTGLVCTQLGLPDGPAMLAAAERVAEAAGG